MDNKQAIEELKKLYGNTIQIVDPISGEYKLDSRCTIALDKAIASLEAWDKIEEEMKYFYNVYDSFNEEELTKEELWTVSLGKRHYKHALNIINKHLKEIEE